MAKVKDLAGFGKVASTVTQAVTKAISTLYKPTAILKEGRARADVDAYRIEVLAKAKVAADLLVDGSESDIAQRAKQRFVFEQLQQQSALDGIFRRALRLSQRKKSFEGRKISDDWMYRFVTNGKEVSSEEIRDIFARLLIQQASRTEQTVSFMTLDALRLFEPRHAKYFETFCRLYWIFGPIFTGINVGGAWTGQNEFAELVELGMVNRHSDIEGPRLIRLTDFYFTFEPDSGAHNLDALFGDSKFLSARGRELSRIIFPETEGVSLNRLSRHVKVQDYERSASKILKADLQYQYIKRVFDMVYDYGNIVINPRKFGSIHSSRKNFIEVNGDDVRVDWSAAKGYYVPGYLRTLANELDSS